MPTSSQRIITMSPRAIRVLTVIKKKRPTKVSQSPELFYIGRGKEQSPSSIQSRASPRNNWYDDDLPEIPQKTRCSRWWLIPLLLLLALLIAAVIALAVVLGLKLGAQDSTTTTTTTTKAAGTTKQTVTTKVTTTTTTTPSCVSPYARAPSGNCVNTLLDVKNCGTIGRVCSSNYTSCSAAVCSNVPVVQLVNATSIWTGGVNGSSDDDIFNVTLPFPITLYNTTTNAIQVTSNGVICLGNCSSDWLESALPNNSFNAAIFPYWTDLFIYAKTWQGIYWVSQGSAPNRTLVFEYYTSHYGSPNEFYHFQVVFFEAVPGTVKFIYFEAYDTGANGTVGVQGSNRGPFLQHSFDEVNSIQANMTLTFDTKNGTVTNSTVG